MANRRSQIVLEPALLRWARERAGFDEKQLADKLKVAPEVVGAWEQSGEISFARVDALAERTYTPVGYLYLSEPPDDRLPIADFRTRGDAPSQRPTPNLLETVYQMQRRQMWMSEELVYQEVLPLGYAGAFDLDSPPQQVAAAMADALYLDGGWAASEGSWTNALRTLRDRIESAGVMVVSNGVVGNDTHRPLDPDEFQGFALVDEYAPLIFVNSRDYKTAQIFTLAHELAHIFVGRSGLSKLEELQPSDHHIEIMCDSIAAEFLVPESDLRRRWRAAMQTSDPYQNVARHFKVSTVVAARRAKDLKLITKEAFFGYYEENKARDWGGSRPDEAKTGGNFWNNQYGRIGPRFGAAVVRALREGRLSYREAYGLTGLKGKTFASMPERFGFAL